MKIFLVCFAQILGQPGVISDFDSGFSNNEMNAGNNCKTPDKSPGRYNLRSSSKSPVAVKQIPSPGIFQSTSTPKNSASVAGPVKRLFFAELTTTKPNAFSKDFGKVCTAIFTLQGIAQK